MEMFEHDQYMPHDKQVFKQLKEHTIYDDA